MLVDYIFDGPETSSATVVLAHGAGAPMDSPFMEAVAAGLAGEGLKSVRFEFSYMQERRISGKKKPPNTSQVLQDFWLKIIEDIGNPERLIIGGKSLGGRIASMVADRAEVKGLICLGYPFHPPGKPENLRTGHLEQMKTPTLVLQGTRDPFGNREEIEGYAFSSSIKVFFLEDGDHSFKPRKSSGRTEEQNLKQGVHEMSRFVKILGNS